MAEILPFRAVRYAGKAAAKLSRVLAPPYDVINPRMKKELLSSSPYNAIRLILGNPSVETHKASDYTAAARTLDAWRKSGVLHRDTRPSLYVYRQDFKVGKKSYRRTGFLALDRLKPFGGRKGGILAHEHTLAGPKADRLNLMKACHANFSPIFSLYSDKSGIGKMLERVMAGKPDAQAVFPAGVRNLLWRVSDPKCLGAFQKAMGKTTLFIADGHHRYETALAYQAHRGPGKTRPKPWDYVLMMFVAMEDPGLVILPTHRMLPGRIVPDPYEILARLTDLGSVTEYSGSLSGEKPWTAMLKAGGKTPTLGFSPDGHKLYFLRFSKKALRSPLLAGLSSAQRGLDVALLHKLILEPWFGITKERVEHDISFTSVAMDAVRRLRRKECACTFFLNPTRIGQLRDVALRKERMPQKSTFFYPKLVTGMAFNDLREF